MRSLKYLNTVLTLIAVLLTLNLWTAWTASPAAERIHFAAPAHAQGVGSTAERQVQMVQELKSLNQSVSRLEKTLTSGKVRVKVEGGGNDK